MAFSHNVSATLDDMTITVYQIDTINPLSNQCSQKQLNKTKDAQYPIPTKIGWKIACNEIVSIKHLVWQTALQLLPGA